MAAPILFDRAPVGLGGICAIPEEETAAAEGKEQPAAEKQVCFFLSLSLF